MGSDFEEVAIDTASSDSVPQLSWTRHFTPGFINVLILGGCFFLLFFAYNTTQVTQMSNDNDNDNDNDNGVDAGQSNRVVYQPHVLLVLVEFRHYSQWQYWLLVIGTVVRLVLDCQFVCCHCGVSCW
jgi:hypothetical protein